MPINYKEYHPKWSLISRLIRYNRAGNRCERCGVLNGSVGKWSNGEWVTPTEAELDKIKQIQSNGYSHWQSIKCLGFTKIVLTVAHLDQDKNNNRFDNLKALCQRDHFGHDRKENIKKRQLGHNWKGNHQLKMDL